ncbi:ExbD/TolR family protein [Neisseria sp. S1]|uniref:ExbD/TolR family protein n=1 Tax=Neisseria sp. S1 TaxID=3318354 RepID=UPI003A8715F7
MAFGSMNSGDDSPMADINMTPLVDVMLVLLIVFMVTMPVLTHSIPLQLPEISKNTEQESPPKEPLRLTIDENGAYYLGAESDKKQDLQALEAELKKAHAVDKDTVLAIAADKKVPYDFVAKALNAAREAGVGKIGFIAEQATE